MKGNRAVSSGNKRDDDPCPARQHSRTALQLGSDAVAGVLRMAMREAAGRGGLPPTKLTVVLGRRRTEELINRIFVQEDVVRQTLGLIAAVVGQTYTEQGDGAPLADDEALERIRDLLLTYDPTIIERHRGGWNSLSEDRYGLRHGSNQ